MKDQSIDTVFKAKRAMNESAALHPSERISVDPVTLEVIRHGIVSVTDQIDASMTRTAFERDYRRRYGLADPKAQAEFQALHLSAFARLKRPDIARLPRAAEKAQPPRTRPVYFAAAGMVNARIFDRDALEQGFKDIGPAVIEEYGSTTLILLGDRFEIGALGEIQFHCSRK